MLQTIKTLLIFLSFGIISSQCWSMCTWHSIEDCNAICNSNTAESNERVNVCQNLCQAWEELNRGEMPPSCRKIEMKVKESGGAGSDQLQYGMKNMMFKIEKLGCCK